MTMYKIYDKEGKMVSKLTVTDKVCYETKLVEVTGINITQIYCIQLFLLIRHLDIKTFKIFNLPLFIFFRT